MTTLMQVPGEGAQSFIGGRNFNGRLELWILILAGRKP